MFAEHQLHTFVRDQAAWRRAMAQPSGDADENGPIVAQVAGAPRGLYRRGSADNAMTLRFLSSLRSSCAREVSGSCDAFHPLQKQWSSSTRIESDSVGQRYDVLLDLLCRNSAAKGHVLSDDGAASAFSRRERASNNRSPQHHHQPIERPRRTAHHHDAAASAQLLAQRLGVMEEAERVLILRREEGRRASNLALFRQQCAALVAHEEYCSRRALFREAIAEKADILEEEQFVFTERTGLSHCDYARLMHLQQRESTRRSVLVREQERTHSILWRLARLEEVQLVEREIERCNRRERQLTLRVRENAA